MHTKRRTSGSSSVEVVVAFTLLASVISLGTPLVVRHGRLLADYRDYQRALEELSNQMERLTALPPDELAKEIQDIEPSSFAAGLLPGAKLRGELFPADMGQRLVLSLTWDDRPSQPVSLVTWIYPEPAAAGPRSDP